jgi:hypothetical protein
LSEPPNCHDPLALVEALLGVARRMAWDQDRIRQLEAVNLELQERLRISEELSSFVVEEPRDGRRP